MGDTLYTTLEKQGNISIITQMTKANKHGRIKRISKNEYVVLATGEVKEYETHAENRAGNKKSLMRTFATIRGLINTNAADPRKVKFITLTYKENMTDPQQLYKDFKAFWQRLMYYHDKKGWQHPLYLIVIEPQQRGAFHGHLLLFYDVNAPFIPNVDFEKIWRHGFTKISKIDHVDNLGAYLTAYLTDIAIDAEEGDEDVVEIDGKKKSIIKGGRLHMYPTGMKIYRCSQALKRPEKRSITTQQAEAHRQSHRPTYAVTRTLRDPASGFETVIYKEWFNDALNDDYQMDCAKMSKNYIDKISPPEGIPTKGRK
jgi:hypothetical protein